MNKVSSKNIHKGIVHACMKIQGAVLAYGMSKFKLADTMGITVGKADEIIKRFFNVVPKVERFLKMLGELGKSRGYIRTALPYRRMRRFQKLEEYIKQVGSNQGFYDFKYLGEVERASMNAPIQGGVMCPVKIPLIQGRLKC